MQNPASGGKIEFVWAVEDQEKDDVSGELWSKEREVLMFTVDAFTTVFRSITFFFWESISFEKGANCSQINVIIGLLMTLTDEQSNFSETASNQPPEFSVVLKKVEGM